MLSITDETKLKKICTHRFENGTDALQNIDDKTQKCPICGKTFHKPISPKEILETSIEILEEISKLMSILSAVDFSTEESIVPITEEEFLGDVGYTSWSINEYCKYTNSTTEIIREEGGQQDETTIR